MRLRAISFILACLLALAALLASDRARPLVVVEAHGSGRWLFNQADYPICVTVRPPPLQPHLPSDNFHPRRSDTA